jgi:glycosyltransferase involved in cell wall biosynthesis
MKRPLRVLMSATSYPRTEEDWQGIFIRHLADALSDSGRCTLGLWAPRGPVHEPVRYCCSAVDEAWLASLAARGGIAHQFKGNKLRAIGTSLSLLRRLRAAYRQEVDGVDLFHVNWLQNALPLAGLDKPAVISILGTDFKLLDLPGMTPLVRQMLKQRRAALVPNADWMAPRLEEVFGDLATVKAIPFGIDDRLYQLVRRPQFAPSCWLAVTRVTRAKLGTLLDWGEPLFASSGRQLHIIGPNQEGLRLPDWVHHHGPASPEIIARDWFPRVTGLVTLSQHSEGRPQVLLEALAAGLPIIASDIDAHRDLLQPEQVGLLVSSPEAFTHALVELEDNGANGALSAAARAMARRTFGTWSDCADRYLDIYRAVTA